MDAEKGSLNYMPPEWPYGNLIQKKIPKYKLGGILF